MREGPAGLRNGAFEDVVESVVRNNVPCGGIDDNATIDSIMVQGMGTSKG